MSLQVSRIRWTQLLVLLSIIMIVAPAEAALNAYMTISGRTQGNIDGDVTLSGRSNTFEINEVHHLLRRNSAAQTMHEPLIVTTPMSEGIPLLLAALDTREPLAVEIKFYRPNSSGGEVHYYTMTLTNATLVAAEPIMLDNKVAANQSVIVRMRLRFEYRDITHRYVPNNQIITLDN